MQLPIPLSSLSMAYLSGITQSYCLLIPTGIVGGRSSVLYNKALHVIIVSQMNKSSTLNLSTLRYVHVTMYVCLSVIVLLIEGMSVIVLLIEGMDVYMYCSKESERERLEKEHSERMDMLREELMRKNEEEKAALYEQLDQLKQQQTSSSSDTSNLSVTEIDGYSVMQSIGMDISNRVVVGEEEKDVLSYKRIDDEEDEVFENGISTPIIDAFKPEGLQLGSSYTDTFINIHTEEEKAKGLPEQSLYR